MCILNPGALTFCCLKWCFLGDDVGWKYTLLQRIAHIWSGCWWSHGKGTCQCYTVMKSLSVSLFFHTWYARFLGCSVLLPGGMKWFDLSSMDVSSLIWFPIVRSIVSLAESSVRVQCWSTKYKGVHEEARADGNHWRRSGRSKSKAWATPERFGLSKCRCCSNEKTLPVIPIPLI